MAGIKSIEKLRTAARNMAKGRNLEHHEECNLLLRIADEIEREITERYMSLPVDADGEVIRVGDVVDGGLGDSGKVHHIELWDDGFVVVYEPEPHHLTRYAPDALRHVKTRTIEDVLRDLLHDTAHYFPSDCEDDIAKAADEIRGLL